MALCDHLEGGPEGGGRLKKEEVQLWLIHLVVWQKPTQNCKAIFLQLKNKLKKKTLKISTVQKSVAFLYTIKELSQTEIKKTTPFTITSKRTKYLGINLTKEIEDLFLENYKTLMKEIEDNTIRWKNMDLKN